MKKAVFAIAKDVYQAETFLERLHSGGFPYEEISVLAPDTEGHHDFGHVKESKGPEGATAGATTGGVIGGVLGLLAGIGALAIPGVGAFVAAGPIMAALSGVGIGATTGGIVGGLIGLGIPEFEAKLYDEKIKMGHYLISVHTTDDDAVGRAKAILEAVDAQDVSVTGLTSKADLDPSLPLRDPVVTKNY